MDGAATPIDDHMNSSLALPYQVPIGVQTYYETICKNQPLARRNIIVKKLRILKEDLSEPEERHEFVVAEVRHLRGHDISDRLEYLVIERSPTGSSSSAKYIVSQSRSWNGDRDGSTTTRGIIFKNNEYPRGQLCLLEELFRLVTIISKYGHLYSTDIDASFWFAATIMETAQAIFPSYDHKSGWFKRNFIDPLLFDIPSECGHQIVAAYRASKEEYPTPTRQSTSRLSVVVSENETEEA